MGLGTTAGNAALNAVTGTGHYISVHTGDPGSTGANEGTGVTRQSITWPSASAKAVSYSTAVTVPADAGTYTHWGVWTAASGGSFVIGGALASEAVLPASGNVVITQIDLDATA